MSRVPAITMPTCKYTFYCMPILQVVDKLTDNVTWFTCHKFKIFALIDLFVNKICKIQ